MPDEQVGLTEGHAPIRHLGGPCPHKQGLALLLELGPLMSLERIFNGEVVQTKLRLKLAQESQAGLM
jgi:hypothetical protein